MAGNKARPNAYAHTPAAASAARSSWLPRRMDDGSKPTVGSNYSITGATKSFCLKRDEFHLLVVNLPRDYCRKDFNTIFILKHTNRRARDIMAI